MKSNHDDQPGGSGLLLGAGAALLMVACCALLPLLLAGGLLASVGGFLGNPWVIGTGIAGIFGGGATFNAGASRIVNSGSELYKARDTAHLVPRPLMMC